MEAILKPTLAEIAAINAARTWRGRLPARFQDCIAYLRGLGGMTGGFPSAGMGNMEASFGPMGAGHWLVDNFTGTLGTQLSAHTADTGQSWTEFSGSWQLQGDGTVKKVSNVNSNQFAGLDSGDANMDITITLSVEAGATDIGMCFRYVDGSNNWAYGWHGNSGGELFLLQDVASVPATSPLAGWSTGDTLRLVCNGNTITAYFNGVQKMQITSAVHNTATKLGLYCYQTSNSYDKIIADKL